MEHRKAKSESKSVGRSAWGCLWVAIAVSAMVFIRGLTLAILWHWWVEPLGFPGVGWRGAWGICAVAAVISPGRMSKEEHEAYTQEFGWQFGRGLAQCVVALGVSALLKWGV